jgi:hypothetical protein
MKNLKNITSQMTNEDLRTAINEIQIDRPLGIIRRDGWIWKIAIELSEGMNNVVTPSANLYLAEQNLMYEAACRFANR